MILMWNVLTAILEGEEHAYKQPKTTGEMLQLHVFGISNFK
jgi:hypothetical protein